MPSERELLRHLFERFNARDIDAALATMHPSVVWANGLDGGYVYGHAAVRSYWTRQWETMDSATGPHRRHLIVVLNERKHIVADRIWGAPTWPSR
jgi:hypothetical protein